VAGEVTSEGFNLIGAADGSSGWIIIGIGADLTGTTASPLDPQLGPLYNNGGPTSTMALSPNSAAVDQGSSFGLTNDQRGSIRPFNYLNMPFPPGGDGSDIGAFELKPIPAYLSLSHDYFLDMTLAWIEFPPGNHSPASGPHFGLQVSKGGLSSGAGTWTTFQNALRYVNNEFEGRDVIASGSAFYRLNSGITNPLYVPPPITLSASNVMTTSATLDGSDIAFGSNTLYWFVYGPDTNYGQSTVTNSLATTTSLVNVHEAVGALAPGTLYHCQLMVMDDWGIQGGGDLTFSTATPVSPPTAVTYAASSVSSSSEQFNGSVNPNGADAAYWFEYGLDTNYSSGITSSELVSASVTNAVPVNILVSGLAASTLYHCQLVASNTAGVSYGGDQAFTTISAATLPPVVVTTTATQVTNGGPVGYTALLNGTVNPEGGATVAWFYYYYTFDGSETFDGVTTPQSVGSGNSTASFGQNITGLPPNITCYFEIAASNSAGVSYGQPYLSFTTTPAYQPPPTVQTLLASSVTTSSAVLNGSANPNGAATTTYFEYGADTNYGNTTVANNIGVTPQSDLTALLTGLSSFTTYHYRIDAVNSGGTSYGADTNFTTAWIPAPPTLVSPGSLSAPGPLIITVPPLFTWSGAGQASSYDLVITQSPPPYGDGSTVFTASVGGTSYQLPGGVLQVKTYYAWYMYSFNSLGDESAVSAPLYFETP
jgi:hypothetical protein